RFTEIRITDTDGNDSRTFRVGEPIRISVRIAATAHFEGLDVTFSFGTMDSIRATWTRSHDLFGPCGPGEYEATATMEESYLPPGRYLLSIMLGDPADDTVIHDLHLRLYAISITGQRGERLAHQGKLLPWGK